ncbi:unnamed protein product [Enterobius vermicularis]|uniref:Pentatricopeptide repeat-containing protein n=1 Tax=Enterobius vermicularis TaxID=51028 RepID=A0A0N4V9H7_ENTVE|nr:unnamed protein product [Enterobius vermicularis]
MKQLELRLSTLSPTTANSSTSQSFVSSTKPLIRNQRQDPFPMPELPLIKFSGDPKEWPSSWDWFQDAVDAKPKPDWQKLTYLKSCLTGTAHQTISAFALANKDYHLVVQALKDKYGSPTVIVSSLYDELECLPNVNEQNF